MRLFLTLLLANITLICAAQCPKAGTYKNEKQKKLNLLKNASASVSHSQTSASLPLKNLIPSKKRIDKELYRNGAFVTTEGIRSVLRKKEQNLVIAIRRINQRRTVMSPIFQK